MKKILIIGAGWEQLALLQQVKSEGHYIIATHPSLNAEGFVLADKFFVKKSDDVKSHLIIAETHQIDAILTDNCDYSFYTASIVASKLNLPFAPIQSAIYSNDKYAQRACCKDLKVKQPTFQKVRTLQEVKKAAADIGFPIILKPVDSRGTFGVTILQEENQLETAFYDAIHFSPSRRLICEKFIEGTLVTVDGFCFLNGHQSLTVASRKFEKGAKPVTKEIIYPGLFSDELNKRLLDAHEIIVDRLGYVFGHTHGEYIVTSNNDIYLVECTNRGGGVYTSTVIVPLLTDTNLNEILLSQALGEDHYEPSSLGLNWMKRAIMLTFLDYEVGKVVKSINLGEMLLKPYTVRFRSIYGENDMVESVENCASRHSMLVLQGEDVEQLMQNYQDFKNKLAIEYYS